MAISWISVRGQSFRALSRGHVRLDYVVPYALPHVAYAQQMYNSKESKITSRSREFSS